MVYYYKVYSLNTDEFLGVVTSKSFRTWTPQHNYIAEGPKDANFFVFNGEKYRAPWMMEPNEIVDKYQTVDLFIISKEEYDKILNLPLKD